MMEAGKSLSLMKPSRFGRFIWHDCAYIFLMMDLLMEGSFQAFGVAHHLAMLTTLIVAVVLTAYARSGPDEGNLKVIRYVLGALLLISVALDPVLIVVRYGVEELGREMVINDSLPFHLCDVVAIFLAFALFTKNQRLAEIGYLWAIAGNPPGAHHADALVRSRRVRILHLFPPTWWRTGRGNFFSLGFGNRSIERGDEACDLLEPWIHGYRHVHQLDHRSELWLPESQACGGHII